MSTTTKPSTTTSEDKDCRKKILLICVILAAVPVVNLVIYYLLKYSDRPVHVKYLTVVVESTAVSYYNVTPDGRVDSIIGVGIRAGNPDPHAPPLNLTSLILYVKKGKEKIADGVLPDVFNLTAGSEELVYGEAFGLVPVPDRYRRTHLDAKVLEEVRADVAAGEGIVRVELNGRLGKLWTVVTCEDVVIDCSGRSAVRAQKVDCQLKGYPTY